MAWQGMWRNDYYPFGMQMPGRKYTAGSAYRYGFNGQEVTPEISEGSTTALYWEYDGRIGKRWNTDPVIKPWESPYSSLSNSPISHVDPKGDDDYFDTKGKYLGSDKVGTGVRVISNPIGDITNLYSKDGATINKKIGQKNSQVLSSFIKGNDPKDLIRKTVLLNGVFNHYAKDAGVKNDINAASDDNFSSPAFTVGKAHVYYNIFYDGNRDIVDNSQNIVNTFYHEKLHQDDKKGIKYFSDHVEIYINQFKHTSFGEMSESLRQGYIRSAMNYILNEGFGKATDASGNDYGNDLQMASQLITKMNNVIKSKGYTVTIGGLTSLNLYKDKKLVSEVKLTELKDPR